MAKATKKKTTQSAKDQKLLKALGKNIRENRKEDGRTYYDLVGEDLLIKNRQHWQKIESGQKNINITTFFKIAASLKIDPAELIEGIRNPYKG